MQRADSLEKTLMLRQIEGRRRRCAGFCTNWLNERACSRSKLSVSYVSLCILTSPWGLSLPQFSAVMTESSNLFWAGLCSLTAAIRCICFCPHLPSLLPLLSTFQSVSECLSTLDFLALLYSFEGCSARGW